MLSHSAQRCTVCGRFCNIAKPPFLSAMPQACVPPTTQPTFAPSASLLPFLQELTRLWIFLQQSLQRLLLAELLIVPYQSTQETG